MLYDRKLYLQSCTWLENTPYYDSRAVIYDHNAFIRLTTAGQLYSDTSP